jgi:hypothetical protein
MENTTSKLLALLVTVITYIWTAWIHLAQDRDQWLIVMNTFVVLWVPQ